jgi:transcriptional regulator with XRE-family HTH domain
MAQHTVGAPFTSLLRDYVQRTVNRKGWRQHRVATEVGITQAQLSLYLADQLPDSPERVRALGKACELSSAEEEDFLRAWAFQRAFRGKYAGSIVVELLGSVLDLVWSKVVHLLELPKELLNEEDTDGKTVRNHLAEARQELDRVRTYITTVRERFDPWRTSEPSWLPPEEPVDILDYALQQGWLSLRQSEVEEVRADAARVLCQTTSARDLIGALALKQGLPVSSIHLALAALRQSKANAARPEPVGKEYAQ